VKNQASVVLLLFLASEWQTADKVNSFISCNHRSSRRMVWCHGVFAFHP